MYALQKKRSGFVLKGATIFQRLGLGTYFGLAARKMRVHLPLVMDVFVSSSRMLLISAPRQVDAEFPSEGLIDGRCGNARLVPFHLSSTKVHIEYDSISGCGYCLLYSIDMFDGLQAEQYFQFILLVV